MYLGVDRSSVGAAVDVLDVQGVAGEDDGVATNLPLDDVRGLVANNLPEEVTGNVGRHCEFGG